MKPSKENLSDIEKNLELDSSPNKGRKLKIIIILVLILIVFIAARKIIKGKDAGQAATYKTEEIKTGGLTVTVSATGTLEPTNQVSVGSELSGIVETVDVDFNDHVKKGEVLATVDTSRLDAQIKQLRAALAAAHANVLDAEATVVLSRDNLDRLKKVWKLSGQKVPSKNDLDTAEATFKKAIASEESAKALVSQAKANLEVSETDLGKMTIRSPINGIVLNRAIEPGQTVAASFQTPVLFTLAEDLTKMELDVAVDEADVGSVRKGQEATFTVDAYPDKTFKAKILQVRYGASTTNGVVTYETILSVENKDLLLRPGMTATASIIVNKIHDSILVPNMALRYAPPFENAGRNREFNRNLFSRLLSGRPRRPMQGNKKPEMNRERLKRVWVLEKGRPRPVFISTGPTDGDMTQVTGGGLKPGMNVIIGSTGQM